VEAAELGAAPRSGDKSKAAKDLRFGETKGSKVQGDKELRERATKDLGIGGTEELRSCAAKESSVGRAEKPDIKGAKRLRFTRRVGMSAPDPSAGKVRQKMAVGEGRSMMHWMNKKVNVTRKRGVTMEEVKKHNTSTDCWTVFRGRVL